MTGNRVTCVRTMVTRASAVALKPDHRVRATFNMNRINEPNLMRLGFHNQRGRPLAGAEKPDTANHFSIRDPGHDENNVFPRSEVIGLINLKRV